MYKFVNLKISMTCVEIHLGSQNWQDQIWNFILITQVEYVLTKKMTSIKALIMYYRCAIFLARPCIKVRKLIAKIRPCISSCRVFWSLCRSCTLVMITYINNEVETCTSLASIHSIGRPSFDLNLLLLRPRRTRLPRRHESSLWKF